MNCRRERRITFALTFFQSWPLCVGAGASQLRAKRASQMAGRQCDAFVQGSASWRYCLGRPAASLAGCELTNWLLRAPSKRVGCSQAAGRRQARAWNETRHSFVWAARRDCGALEPKVQKARHCDAGRKILGSGLPVEPSRRTARRRRRRSQWLGWRRQIGQVVTCCGLVQACELAATGGAFLVNARAPCLMCTITEHLWWRFCLVHYETRLAPELVVLLSTGSTRSGLAASRELWAASRELRAASCELRDMSSERPQCRPPLQGRAALKVTPSGCQTHCPSSSATVFARLAGWLASSSLARPLLAFVCSLVCSLARACSGLLARVFMSRQSEPRAVWSRN